MKLFVRLLIVIGFLSCGKEESDLSLEELSTVASVKATATVRYYGPVEVDGCGWVLVMDTATLSAKEVPSALLVDGKKVEIEFKEKGTAPCGLNPKGLVDIHLMDIR